MDVKNITITPEAAAAIERLQHHCGTYEFYNATLTRLFNFVLDQSDEIGMDDTEAIHTLRVLQYLKEDLAQISNKARTPIIHTTEEKVESTFAGVSLAEVEARNQTTERTAPGDQLDEPREMLADVKRAWQRVNELQAIISEAITHAQNAGEKYNSVISDLADVNGDMEATAATLDAIMAIDPDNYEPKELTETEKAAQFVQRSRDALTYGKELLDDALDHAVRADFKPLVRRVTTTRELTVTAVNHIAELTEELNAITKEDEQ